VRRVLAPGGRFVLVTARSAADASTGPWNPALRRYEPAALRALLLDAGFAESSVEERDDGPQVAVARA
jgi:hypothetical protein